MFCNILSIPYKKFMDLDNVMCIKHAFKDKVMGLEY